VSFKAWEAHIGSMHRRIRYLRG